MYTMCSNREQYRLIGEFCGPLSEYMMLKKITNIRRSITRMLKFVAFHTGPPSWISLQLLDEAEASLIVKSN